MNALIIREPWISLILSDAKSWEMRSTRCNIRGRIGLIRKGTGMVVGTAELTDSLPPLDRDTFSSSRERHRVPPEMDEQVFRDGWIYPWVLKNARPLLRLIPAGQKPGQVKWVPLSADAIADIIRQEGEAA